MLLTRSKRIKYQRVNVFLLRQLSSKISSMGFTMGTLAILFTLTLLFSNYAVGLSNIKNEIEGFVPFDVSITLQGEEENFQEVAAYMEENDWAEESRVYRIYRGEDDRFTEVLRKNGVRGGYFQRDTYMKLSDYNALRNMLELETINLQQDEFALHGGAAVITYYEKYLQQNPILLIDQRPYQANGVYSEDFAQNGHNGAGFIVVVPDVAVSEMEIYYSQYAAKTNMPGNEELYQDLQQYEPQNSDRRASSAEREGEIDHGMGPDSL